MGEKILKEIDSMCTSHTRKGTRPTFQYDGIYTGLVTGPFVLFKGNVVVVFLKISSILSLRSALERL